MTASGHESGGGDPVTGPGHDDLPGEQGNVNARAGTGSSQKTKTGPGASDPDEAGSGPKTATDQGGIHDPSVPCFSARRPGSPGGSRMGAVPVRHSREPTDDRRKRTAPGSSAREGAEEAEASSCAPDERLEALPLLSLDMWRAGGEEAPREAAQGAS